MTTAALRARTAPASGSLSWAALADSVQGPVGPRVIRVGIQPVRVLQFAITGLVVGNLGRAPVLFRGPEWPVLLNDVLIWLALGTCALACLQARRLRIDALVGIASVFACVGVGAALWAAQKYALSTGELLGSLAYLVRWLSYFGLYVCAVNVCRDDDAAALWESLQRTALLFAAFGVVQVFAFTHFAQQVYPAGPDNMGWDYQGRRLVSTLLDPNFAGIFMLLPLLVYAAQLAFGERVTAWKPLLLFAAILMTVSRGTIVAMVVGLLVIVAARGMGRRLLRAASAVVLLAAPAVPVLVQFATSFNKFAIDGSAMARVQSWLRALRVVADNPVFGIGFNTYLYVQRAYGWALDGRSPASLDGGLLFVMVLTGVVGLATYVVLLGVIVVRCRRLWRNRSAPVRARAFALGTAAGVVALVIHSVTVNSLLFSFVMEVLWFMTAIVYLDTRAAAAAAAPSL